MIVDYGLKVLVQFSPEFQSLVLLFTKKFLPEFWFFKLLCCYVLPGGLASDFT